jgi:hypothetical protein
MGRGQKVNFQDWTEYNSTVTKKQETCSIGITVNNLQLLNGNSE